MNAFRGATGKTVNIAATTANARVQVTSDTGIGSYRVRNAGTVDVFFREGDVTSVASVTTDMSIPAGAIEVLTFGSTHVAAITASGSATIYITPGDGV